MEVLLLGEPIDSFLMMHLTDYHEKEFFLIDQDEEESGEKKMKIEIQPQIVIMKKSKKLN